MELVISELVERSLLALRALPPFFFIFLIVLFITMCIMALETIISVFSYFLHYFSFYIVILQFKTGFSTEKFENTPIFDNNEALHIIGIVWNTSDQGERLAGFRMLSSQMQRKRQFATPRTLHCKFSEIPILIADNRERIMQQEKQ
jgi:hypothetical protein